MRKRIKRFIALLMSVIMLANVLPIHTFASETAKKDDSIALVWEEDNVDDGVSYDNIEEAWSAACEKGNILLKNNWNTEKVLTVPEKKSVIVYMNGFTIDRGLTEAKDSGEVFLIRKNATLSVYGTDNETEISEETAAKITGGYNGDGGGGIHIQENGEVYLYGVQVCGNKTNTSSGGGGVRLQGDNAYLEMDAFTVICDNSAGNGNGGGISICGENGSVVGGTVKNNETLKSGGGISFNENGSSVSGTNIIGNTAKDKGGGIYMSQGCGGSVSNCKIEENKVTGGNGGGIYVDGNGGSLSYSQIQKNTAKEKGGGIYVDVGDSLLLAGNLTVSENKVSAGNAAFANLFLATNSEKSAYISGSPTDGEVHIGWDKTVRTGDNVKISNVKNSYSSRCIVSDVEGYHIYWSWVTEDGKNDRLLRASKTNYNNEIEHKSTNVSVNERYTVIENGYGEYDLQEGIFSYKATTGGNLDAVYYYSDGYFEEGPKVYNDHLATMSLALTMSAFNTAETAFDKDMHNGTYANRFRNAKMLLSDIGVADNDIHVSDSFMVKPSGNSIGVIMGAKNLNLTAEQEEPYILLPIAVRGAGYETEWVSNVTIGSSGEAAGFSDAADKVMAELDKFLASDTSIDLNKALEEGRVYFWVTGFSRSAATANLVSKRLTDIYGEKNRVYAYCFEAPKGGLDEAALKESWTDNGAYLNIHNIINTGDLVPFVAPMEMGFKRYGVDHYVPGDAAGEAEKSVYTTKKKVSVTTYADNEADIVGDSDYKSRRSVMLHQLAILDDTIIFDDYFSLGTMNYVGYAVGTKELVGPLKNGTKTTAAEWIPVFVRHLVEWAANGTYSWSTVDGDGFGGDYRKFYSTNTKFCGKNYVTVETALQDATSLVFGIDNSDAFMEAMMFRMNVMMSSTWDVYEFYEGVVQGWRHNEQFRQRRILGELWDLLNEDMKYSDGTKVPKLTDFVEEDQEEELKKSVYSLLSFLFLFVNRDYDKEIDLDGVDTTQIHLGTLLYNMSNVLQCHYPEVCMAWLRTYDSHYEKNDTFKYEDTTVKLKADKSAVPETIKADVTVGEAVSKITLSAVMSSEAGMDAGALENGSAIYYRIYKNDEAEGGWTLYQDPIEIDISDHSEYRIRAYAVRFEQKSSETEITDDVIRGLDKTTGTLIGKGSVKMILACSISVMITAGAVSLYYKKKNNRRN